jgi:hypothetical protein
MGIKNKNVWDHYSLLINNFFITIRSLPPGAGLHYTGKIFVPMEKGDASNNCMFEFISVQTQHSLHIPT